MQTLLRAFIAVSAILIELGVKDGGSEGGDASSNPGKV